MVCIPFSLDSVCEYLIRLNKAHRVLKNWEKCVIAKVRYLYNFTNNLPSKQNQKKNQQIVLETIAKILYKIWQDLMMGFFR